MKTFRKTLLGLLVALVSIIPLSLAVTAVQPTPTSDSIIKIASDHTPTPARSGGGCPGGPC